MKTATSMLLASVLLIFGCDTNNQIPSGNNGGGSKSSNEWLIPQGQVFDGGPGKDGIPAIDKPQTSGINEINYLSDDDLVVGYSFNGAYRAYPHKILDWHEIINDNLKGTPLAVTYCPLTGTGIAWNRMIQGSESTFGVSGLLYNSNLIPYDRKTDSNWCQISLKCVNGELKGSSASTLKTIETSWKTWKTLFPNSSVVTTETGFNRNYENYPYGNYKTNNFNLLFPVSPRDERLLAKERVLAIIVVAKAKVYRFDEFANGTRILGDTFNGREIIIVGNKEMNFMMAFGNSLNGEIKTFTAENDPNKMNVFSDAVGNKYDLFGQVIEGPDTGSSLVKVNSFMAYWFSIGAFYPTAIIYNN